MPESVKEIFGRLNGGVSATIRNCGLLGIWTEINDDTVKQNTEPIKIQNRVLYVAASSPVWAQELSFLKPQIIKKFNERAGAETINDIRFRAMGGN
ncbi:MAG: DUF721 domain-containing protein [Candidatus Margulisbacteria bacterium]|nr:DUF721 domain-containing protein [Candidatus Margulisiibacteriota bacterium]